MRRLRHLIPLVVLAMLALAPPSGAAVAGALDPSFANGGAFIRDIAGNNADGFNAVAVSGDGSIFAAGGAYITALGREQPIVAKFTSGGVLDGSFGSGGIAIVAVPVGAAANSIVVQPDGKPLYAGRYSAGSLIVGRLTTGGAPDTSYGLGSGFATRTWTQAPQVAGLVYTPDGGSVVAGSEGTSNTAKVAYQRLDSAGNNYAGTYAGAAEVTQTIGAGDHIHAIAPTGDGGFFAVGTTNIAAVDQFAFAKITALGALDPGFKGIGKTTVAIGGQALGFGAVLQPDGRIVASGDVPTGATSFQVALVRLDADGSLDNSFGTGGIVKIAPLGNERNYGLAIQPDGKLLAIGSANDDAQFSVVRLDASGAPDMSFGVGGRSTVALEPGGASAVAAAVQPGGRIVTVGGTASADTQESVDSGLVGLLGADQPPVSTITSPSKSKLKRRKFTKLAGTAGPAGDVVKVEVAIRRLDAKQLKRKRCIWIKGAHGSVKKIKDKTKKCAKPVWVKATGTTSWTLKLKKKLAAGSYRLYSRATLARGATETSFTTNAGNLRKLKLKK